MVTIELYGVPRMRAGRDEIAVEADCLGDALAALGRECPVLAPSVINGRRLQPCYVVAINGIQFTVDAKHPLRDGDAIVLLSADAGG
jgi:molybdopterin converting factor small subunit